jgi:hypothetical protein
MSTLVVNGARETASDYYQVGSRLRGAARAFRLRFHGCLGNQRSIKGVVRHRMVSTVDADTDMLHISKSLFARNPVLTRLSSAKSELRNYFNHATFPFDDAVRILYVPADSEAEEQEKLNRFVQQMRRRLDAYSEAAEAVRQEWPRILAEAREKLKDLFDPMDYPSESRLRSMFRVEFVPVNVELPAFYAGVSQEEYRRALQEVENRFAQAAAVAEVAAVQMLEDALDGLISSLKGYEDGQQKTVKFTRMERVLEAFAECREKYREVGLLASQGFEQAFERLRRELSLYDTPDSFDELRKNKTALHELRTRVEQLADAMKSSAEPIRRRAVQFLEEMGYDAPADAA